MQALGARTKERERGEEGGARGGACTCRPGKRRKRASSWDREILPIDIESHRCGDEETRCDEVRREEEEEE